MQNLMDAIKDNFGVDDVKLENGEIIVIDDKDKSETESSQVSISLSAEDANNNKLEAFRSKDVVNFDNLYLGKNGATLNGNVSQIVNDYKTYIKDGKSYTVKNENAQTYATDDTSLVDVMGDDNIPKTINIRFKDQNGVLQQAQIVLQDQPDADGHKSYFWIDSNRDGVKDSNEIFDIYTANGNKTPAHDTITTSQTIDPVTCEVCTTQTTDRGLTYKQFSDVLAMITSGNLPASNSFDDYQAAVKAAREEIDSGLDSEGKLYLKDKTNPQTKIDLSITDDSHALSFQANNAITIDSAQVNFFKTLQDAIEAVTNKNNYPDNNSNNPRNIGIQGAIEAIDHVNDHIRRMHATIGAVSNEFQMTIDRTDMLIVNVQELQSDNIDTDLAEASMKLNSLSTSYQALLASIAKVNNLTLLNYLR
jgi:flagellar hook-associated protein 3 FlgL